MTFKSAYTASAESLAYGDLFYEIIDGEVSITGSNTLATEIIIPSEIDGMPVTSIDFYAFGFCEYMTSITIPSSVASIEIEAFYLCKSLLSINVDEDNEYYCDVDGVLFDKDKTTLIQYTLGSSTETYTMPDSVTRIEDSAFLRCKSIKQVILSDSLTSIGNNAFERCESLTSLEIPASVDSIGEYAFYACTSLTDITVDEDSEYFCDIDGILFNIDKTELILCPSKKSLGEYEIPNTVKKIGYGAFYYCHDLTSILIPNSVLIIGDDAFHGCDGLTSVIVPNSVTYIGSYSFALCTNLTSIDIPNSVKYIFGYSFYNCTSLKSIVLPDSIDNLFGANFIGCTSLSYVVIPDSITEIDYSTFNGCSSLTSITIPYSVTTFGYNAFNPKYLKTIYGYVGSAAETYANENGIAFIPLDANLETGDLSGNGDVDSDDIVILKKAIYGKKALSPNQAKAADINGDGKINAFDLALLKRNIKN